MAHPTSGKHRCFASNASFLVGLGDGESVTLSIDGKFNGVLAGVPVSGYGGMEYTYVEGASEWVRTDSNGSASGPISLPITLSPQHNIVYDPKGRCSGKVSVEVSGEPVVETIGFKHKKMVWRMKGRTATLIISVTQVVDETPPCYDPANNTICVDSDGLREWCDTGAPVGCVEACKAIIDGGLCG